MKHAADLNAWTGDIDDLVGHEDQRADDPDLCARVFASKQEAFAAGMSLAVKGRVPASFGKTFSPVAYDRTFLVSEANHVVGASIATWPLFR
jgi:hypothetical protein